MAFSFFRRSLGALFLFAVVILVSRNWLSSKGIAEKREREKVTRAVEPTTEAIVVPEAEALERQASESLVGGLGEAVVPAGAALRQVAAVPKISPGGRPFDRLELSETLDEAWPGGRPVGSGWHPRVRIVRTSFKSGLLRIEERVKVKIQAGELVVLESVIKKAMDARHVLVSSSRADDLAAGGFQAEASRSGNFLRVAVSDPARVGSVPGMVERLAKIFPGSVEPDAVVEASAQAGDPLVGAGLAWHLENLGLLQGHRAGADISAEVAWDRRTDASSVLVAVIDSGISANDPELAPSMRLMPGETLGDGVDNDGNGYVDDVRGYDFYEDDTVPQDELGHGSMCAALIGAAGNNNNGSTGVAWKASILNCRFLDRNGLGILSDAIDAIDYSRQAGARILNLSWSYMGDAPLLAEALGRCDEEGILMVCASGNSGLASPVPAPASIDLPHVVAVAATTAADGLAGFSVTDPSVVDLAAPGVDLLVALGSHEWNPSGEVRYGTGTSFSAALVSGGLALGLAEFPLESPDRVLRRLLETVDPVEGGAAALASGGRLNLGRMLGRTLAGVPHDLFAERAVLKDSSGQWSGRNDGAGVEAVDVNLGLSPVPVRTIWFEWTSPTAGLLRVGSGSGVELAVFAGTGDLPGALLARSRNGEVLEIAVTAGQRLFWMLDSAAPAGGGLKLTWQLPPPNDNWSKAGVVGGLPLTVQGNSLGATVETFEQSQLYSSLLPGGSVWWKWTPGVTAKVWLSTVSDHVLFLMPIGTGGMPVFSWPDEFSAQPVVAGQSYAVVAIPLTPAAAGNFTWTATREDDFAILAGPSDVAVLAGETAVLEVQVASSEPVGYQWYKDGAVIPFATAATLKLSPVTEKSFGSYRVTVSGGTNVVQSEPALVSVREGKPRLVALTPRKPVVTGQAILLGGTFRSATEIHYAWEKNGQVLTGATSSSLSIPVAALTDTGTYRLTATNAVGLTSVTLQVDVVATPWNGWVNRTPGTTGSGKILNVALDGNRATAFTQTEWLNSTDGGQTWISSPMPQNLAVSSAAGSPDGTVLVLGTSSTNRLMAYGKTEIWRRSPAGSWSLINPVAQITGSGPVAITDFYHLTFFDGEWWAVTGEQRAVRSADGIQWASLADPANPAVPMRALAMFRFEDRVAISYWTSSSAQAVQLRLAGGGVKALNFGGSVPFITRIDGASYSPAYLGPKIRDQENFTSPVAVALQPSGFAEGMTVGDRFLALGNDAGTLGGTLWYGMHEKSRASKAMGFSCYAKSGDRWLVGYPSGRLWSGTDLSQLPPRALEPQVYNPVSKAYRDEFTFGAYHSSDGANWQLLGAAQKDQVVPLSAAGGKFLHALQGLTSNPAGGFFSAAMYPEAGNATNSNGFPGSFFTGDSGLLRFQSDSSGKVAQWWTDGAAGTVRQDINLGLNWESIDRAVQIEGRWFVRGVQSSPWKAFLVTSTDGVNWQPSALPAGCTVGKKGSVWVAIEKGSSGYLSTNGISWTPFIPQGLPPTGDQSTPATIVAYRSYFVAQCDGALYVSADGVSWALGSAPLPVLQLHANRHSLLAVTATNLLLQPGGETESGPWLELPETHREVSVTRHQPFVYELAAGDADGDLVSVECLLDGQGIASLTAAPFVFKVDAELPGDHAVEFVARDSRGRISRVTSKLTATVLGVMQTSDILIDADFSNAVKFGGDYYRVYKGSICVWRGGNFWRSVSASSFNVVSLVANQSAIVGSMAGGILSSRDGVNWVRLGGFNLINSAVAVLRGRGETLELQDNDCSWASADGFSWERTEKLRDGFISNSNEPIVWVDENFGYSGAGKVTYDGGKLWFPLSIGLLDKASIVVPVEDGFLMWSGSEVSRFLRGESSLTSLFKETASPAKLYLSQAAGVAFVSKSGEFLRSTRDGVIFTNHTPPPNQMSFKMIRHQGEWLAVSADRICATSDLKTWRTLLDYATVMHPGQVGTLIPKVSNSGLDGLSIIHPTGFYNLVLNRDFSVTWIPTLSTALDPVPTGLLGGVRQFKGRDLAFSPWFHTRDSAGGDWQRAPVDPGPGFVQPFPHEWPSYFLDRYVPTGMFAATGERFVMLKKDSFNPSENYVFTSDDGVGFKIHPWAGPLPLAEIQSISASADGFLAAATQGRVLRSADGLVWSAAMQISPALSISSTLHFNGRWHVAGTVPLPAPAYGQVEVWSSTDGLAWSRTSVIQRFRSLSEQPGMPAFVAHGVARMDVGANGWMRSTDGLDWQYEPAVEPTIGNQFYQLKGEHPEGLLVSIGNGFGIADAESGTLLRSIATGTALTRWLSGWPFISSAGQLVEWTEQDPRLTTISAENKIYGVGDSLVVDLSAAELSGDGQKISISLTADFVSGNDDDRVIGVPAWGSGATLSGGARRFTLPLPPSVQAGRFRVAARLLAGGPDLSVANNQVVSSSQPVEIPGYQLRLTTSGEGRVDAADPRVLYPLGAELQLQAVPAAGYAFRGWTGSFASAESVISVRMTEDQQLNVSFIRGYQVTVKAIGNGAVRGAQSREIRLPDESVNLSQSAAPGWKFNGWRVNGLARTGASLSLVPTTDSVIEGVFIPDFHALRTAAFENAPAGADRSWNADPDGDGLTNWQEILLSDDPLSAAAFSSKVARRSEGLRLVFTRPQGTAGEPWVSAEFSENLSGWQAADSLRMTERILGAAAGIETVEITLPMQSGKKGFFRLRMIPPPEDL